MVIEASAAICAVLPISTLFRVSEVTFTIGASQDLGASRSNMSFGTFVPVTAIAVILVPTSVVHFQRVLCSTVLQAWYSTVQYPPGLIT